MARDVRHWIIIEHPDHSFSIDFCYFGARRGRKERSPVQYLGNRLRGQNGTWGDIRCYQRLMRRIYNSGPPLIWEERFLSDIRPRPFKYWVIERRGADLYTARIKDFQNHILSTVNFAAYLESVDIFATEAQLRDYQQSMRVIFKHTHRLIWEERLL